MPPERDHLVRVATLEDIQKFVAKAVKVDGRSIALFWHEGKVYATDNQCPHMGYPLTRGRVRSGVLTCDWHGWSYDLQGGGCFTGGCDDLDVFPVTIRDGDVFLDRDDIGAKRKDTQTLLLQEGLNSGDTWTLSKAIAMMLSTGISEEETLDLIVRHADRRAAANDLESGCEQAERIINGVRVASRYPIEERLTPLMMAAAGVAGRINKRPPLQPMPAPMPWEKLVHRIRLFSTDINWLGSIIGKCLLTAHHLGDYDDRIVPLMYECAVSPYLIGAPDTLIYLGYLAEILETFGWEKTEALTCHLGGMLLGQYRSAPDEIRQHAIDLYKDTETWIDEAVTSGNDPSVAYDEEMFVRGLVSGDLEITFRTISDALRSGVDLDRLITSMVLTAADRMARTPINMNPGWDQLCEELRIASSLRIVYRFGGEQLAARALFHAAWKFYTDRWLNITPRPLNEPTKGPIEDITTITNDEEIAHIIQSIETIQPNEIGRQIRMYLQAGYSGDLLLSEIGRAILRDDTGGPLLKTLRTVFDEWADCEGHPARYKLLIGLARLATDVRKGTNNQSAIQTAQRFARGQTAVDLYET